MELLDRYFFDRLTKKQLAAALAVLVVAVVALCNAVYGGDTQPGTAAEACRRVVLEDTGAYEDCMSNWGN